MTLYEIPIACLWCAGELAHTTDAVVAHSESKAVMKCLNCDRGWTVTAFMRPLVEERSTYRRRRREAKRQERTAS